MSSEHRSLRSRTVYFTLKSRGVVETQGNGGGGQARTGLGGAEELGGMMSLESSLGRAGNTTIPVCPETGVPKGVIAPDSVSASAMCRPSDLGPVHDPLTDRNPTMAESLAGSVAALLGAMSSHGDDSCLVQSLREVFELIPPSYQKLDLPELPAGIALRYPELEELWVRFGNSLNFELIDGCRPFVVTGQKVDEYDERTRVSPTVGGAFTSAAQAQDGPADGIPSAYGHPTAASRAASVGGPIVVGRLVATSHRAGASHRPRSSILSDQRAAPVNSLCKQLGGVRCWSKIGALVGQRKTSSELWQSVDILDLASSIHRGGAVRGRP
ncbi:hypothetical protein TREMEDRAFT_66612 [Tremella mesenterica DSM 1558]|uniref:uncharacterized protein n=1 Tax=Tremella mesenterica (strain ATCC 24925 / CBS 8224 / DSM 1558 / NBRC 9311 / NRRL Y-6157 / RJB 2259-6 / UBC 559-6) TaxID=578456 RepID=UPI00032D28B5|nr:uncharacterized protein TREMEDRAFT_66612 [Tremella mesenterica DSM 1558]EIW65412.1 hypothetical protein TREMEDRAFT_66612 [Tremella mesenterica DSM 1558]